MLDQSFFAAIADTRFVDVRWFPEIDSTNRYLIDEARSGAPEGVIAVTDFQTSGRGRRQRRWIAESGTSLLASILLRPKIAPRDAFHSTAVVALAILDALGECAGLKGELKWPNDVVVGDRKLAGILAESIVGEETLEAVVVGFGLNVEGSLPTQLRETGTTIADETDHEIPRTSLLAAILRGVEHRYPTMGTAHLTQEYKSRCSTLGRDIVLSLENSIVTGRAVQIEADGSIVIRTEAGDKSFAAGDVVHLRSTAR